LTWAQGILNANINREVIVATHSYLNPNGTSTIHSDTFGLDYVWWCSFNRLFGLPAGVDAFIKLNPNSIMVVCGHQIPANPDLATTTPTSAYAPDVGGNGNGIHQLFINHQFEAKGGNSYMAL
jgi:hypothetical protein